MYGATDVTGSALRRIWQFGIQVVFLSPQGHQLLGKVQPAGNSPNLIWLQHQAIMDSQFRLQISQQLIHDKIEAAITQTRYFQRQGKAPSAGEAITQWKKLQDSCHRSKSLDSLRGVEGTAASAWFQLFASLLPNGWMFPGRKARPATDHVNGLLSLGYTLLVARCQTLLAASDLDPLVGFLHDIKMRFFPQRRIPASPSATPNAAQKPAGDLKQPCRRTGPAAARLEDGQILRRRCWPRRANDRRL